MASSIGQGTAEEDEGPFFMTAKFWKRFVVYLSIALSVAGLVIGAIASLKPENTNHLRKLTVASIIINAFSISLSALTSLDWKTQTTHDKAFAAMLCRIAQARIDADGQVVINAKDLKNYSSS
ncbi:hypothetical protein BDZ45DRAFT_677953 [Acephala macrosclerotiorum]|nr:hypothetical protein BDZ45DRAFT_677953 [Acephala macrosclerotiorum]